MKKTKKISRKIGVSIIVTNLLLVAVIASVVGYLIKVNVGEEVNKYAVGQVEESTNKFQQEFIAIETAVNLLVNEVAERTDVSEALGTPGYLEQVKMDLRPLLKRIGENTDITDSIYIYYNVEMFNREVEVWLLNDGTGKYEVQAPLGIGSYSEYQEWYNEPMDNQKSIWTYPYESAAGGLITSYLAPVIKDGKTIAIVGMDLYLDSVEETLSNTVLYNSGYLYMLHPDGRILAHPDMELGESLLDKGDYKELLAKMNSEESGISKYVNSKGQKSIAAYTKLENGWIIASNLPEREVFAVLNVIIKVILGIALLGLIFSITVASVLGRNISKPILAIVSAVEKMKDGDFTINVETTSNDETLLLANGVNEMVKSVRGLLGQTQSVSNEMLDAASNLASMAEETTATVQQVAATVNEISNGTQDTAVDAEKGAMVASSIDEQFVVLMESSNEMNVSAQSALSANRGGIEALDDLTEKSAMSKTSNENVSKAVSSLDGKASNITDIIMTISAIADQTNLLALNASIEAARAGEAGRGFAVVADEIRKLAEDSREATSQIDVIVQDILAESKETTKVMKEVNEISIEQQEAVSKVSESFKHIFGATEHIIEMVETVTGELKGLEDNKNEIVNIVNNISAVSEETAAATEEVNHSMDEQSNSVSEVAKSAERLNELSHDLNKQIEVFRI